MGVRVGLRNVLFEDCSAFTHVTACTLAKSPSGPLHRRLQPLHYFHDCSDCYRLKRKSPGGILFHRKTPHYHGAHPEQTFSICDLVDMTGMPEAALAGALGLCYANCSLVVNWAAGKGADAISLAEIERNLLSGMEQVRGLPARFASLPRTLGNPGE